MLFRLREEKTNSILPYLTFCGLTKGPKTHQSFPWLLVFYPRQFRFFLWVCLLIGLRPHYKSTPSKIYTALRGLDTHPTWHNLCVCSFSCGPKIAFSTRGKVIRATGHLPQNENQYTKVMFTFQFCSDMTNKENFSKKTIN